MLSKDYLKECFCIKTCEFAIYILRKFECNDIATVDEMQKFAKEIEKAKKNRRNGFNLVPLVGKYTRELKGFTGTPEW